MMRLFLATVILLALWQLGAASDFRPYTLIYLETNVSLSCPTDGDSPLDLSWRYLDKPITIGKAVQGDNSRLYEVDVSDPKSYRLVFKRVTWDTAGLYRCQLGSAYKMSYLASVGDWPNCNVRGPTNDSSLMLGESATLWCNSTYKQVEYPMTWFEADLQLNASKAVTPSVITAEYRLPQPVTAADAQRVFRCKIDRTNNGDWEERQSCRLQIRLMQKPFNVNVTYVKNRDDVTATFTVVAEGNPAPNYFKWQVKTATNWEDVKNVTTTVRSIVVPIPATQPQDPIEYRCVVGNTIRGRQEVTESVAVKMDFWKGAVVEGVEKEASGMDTVTITIIVVATVIGIFIISMIGLTCYRRYNARHPGEREEKKPVPNLNAEETAYSYGPRTQSRSERLLDTTRTKPVPSANGAVNAGLDSDGPSTSRPAAYENIDPPAAHKHDQPSASRSATYENVDPSPPPAAAHKHDQPSASRNVSFEMQPIHADEVKKPVAAAPPPASDSRPANVRRVSSSSSSDSDSTDSSDSDSDNDDSTETEV